MRTTFGLAIACVLCLSLAGGTGAAAAADELQQAHLALKADARALEDQARAAGAAVAAGGDPALSALARDLSDLAERSRRLGREAPSGSYLRQHLTDTADDLARLAERLQSVRDPGEAERVLEEAVSTLFWGFRG